MLIAQAQAHAMAFTCSTVIANNDIAASIVVSANIGIVIQNSKPNKDAQAQESEMNYELDISGDFVDHDRVIVNNAIPARKTKMEVEITAIEIQHYRAMIKRWLTEI